MTTGIDTWIKVRYSGLRTVLGKCRCQLKQVCLKKVIINKIEFKQVPPTSLLG